MRKDLPELKYDDPTPVFCKAHRAKGIKLFKENLNEKKLCKGQKNIAMARDAGKILGKIRDSYSNGKCLQ